MRCAISVNIARQIKKTSMNLTKISFETNALLWDSLRRWFSRSVRNRAILWYIALRIEMLRACMTWNTQGIFRRRDDANPSACLWDDTTEDITATYTELDFSSNDILKLTIGRKGTKRAPGKPQCSARSSASSCSLMWPIANAMTTTRLSPIMGSVMKQIMRFLFHRGK